MILPTASSWPRAFLCLGSAILPRVEEIGEWSSRGSAIHRFIATVGTIGRDRALAEAGEARDFCAAFDLDAIPQINPATGAHELALGYNVMTGACRELYRGGDKARDYSSLGEHEIGVTLDYAADQVGGGGTLIDWKSGWKQVARPSKNRQLQIQALAYARYRGHDSVNAAVGYLRDERPWYVYDDFDALDLDDIAEQFRARAQQIDVEAANLLATGQVHVTIGEHCGGCASFHACPAKDERSRAMAKDAGELAFRLKQALRDGGIDVVRQVVLAGIEMRQIREREDKARGQAIHAVEAALVMYVQEHGPIDMGDGRVFGGETSIRSRLDGDVTYRVLEERFSAETARAATKLTATKGDLEKALKSHAPKGKGAALVREVTEQIDKAGGLKVTTAVEYHIHTPPAKALPAPAKEDASAGIIK